MSTPPPAPSTPPEVQQLRWTEADAPRSARWRCERPGPPPARVVTADDTLSADAAYRLACEGTALLWRGDFQNARQLLQALARRARWPVSTPCQCLQQLARVLEVATPQQRRALAGQSVGRIGAERVVGHDDTRWRWSGAFAAPARAARRVGLGPAQVLHLGWG